MFERTDGVPLHIEELLGALSAEARADGTAIREASVPATIEDAVIARIAQRSPEAQAAARAGAVIGRCFVPEVLAGIMDVPPEALDAPLQELVDYFVLDPPGLRGLYDFRHQLLRDALYRTIPTWERRRFHARAASSARKLEGASEIHASLHYERAGLRRQAFEAAVAGARDAAATVGASRGIRALPTCRGQSAGWARHARNLAPSSSTTPSRQPRSRRTRSRNRAIATPGPPTWLPDRPGKAAEMLVGVLGRWRRQAHSLAERAALAVALDDEITALGADGDPALARAWRWTTS